jgi:hypothetical protein
VRSHAQGGEIAVAHVTPADGGERVEVALRPPDFTRSEGFRPTGYMQRVSRVVEQQPGLSKRAVRESVHGKAATVDLALAPAQMNQEQATAWYSPQLGPSLWGHPQGPAKRPPRPTRSFPESP